VGVGVGLGVGVGAGVGGGVGTGVGAGVGAILGVGIGAGVGAGFLLSRSFTILQPVRDRIKSPTSKVLAIRFLMVIVLLLLNSSWCLCK
jgi:hypothetical protein